MRYYDGLVWYQRRFEAAPRFGWVAALALAVCCALRLARFNARIATLNGTGNNLQINGPHVELWNIANTGSGALTA